MATGAEAQGVDDVPTVKCAKVLALVEVPRQGLAVLASGSTEGGIRPEGSQCSGALGSRCDASPAASVPGSMPDPLVPDTGHDDGVLLLGEERTQGTHSGWFSSWTVCLQTPRLFHTWMVLSLEPEAIHGCQRRRPRSACPRYGLQFGVVPL